MSKAQIEKNQMESYPNPSFADSSTATHNGELGSHFQSQAKGHLTSEVTANPKATEEIRLVAEKTVFDAVIEFQNFFASALSKDRVFGNMIARISPRCSTPSSKQVSNEMSRDLDKK